MDDFQVRVRERLVALLSASGLRVGVPNAPSVLFSHSELGSAASSTERICSSRFVAKGLGSQVLPFLKWEGYDQTPGCNSI